MRAYVEQAPDHGHTAEIIDLSDYRRIPEFDAMFLRLDTNVLGMSWAFARAAWGAGLRVVDDPESMLICMNKAHVQGILEEAGVATPDTLLVTRASRDHLDAEALFEELGNPIICKAPSGAFSSAVEKARTPDELQNCVRRFSQKSDVVLLQRYQPSAYDWRVGFLAGRPLYAAKYHIPKGAWRIRDRPEGEEKRTWARVERIALDDVPPEVLKTAERACAEIGTSLYGVDVKQLEDGRVIVIEVNDNPNLDWGYEFEENSPLFGEVVNRIATEGPRA